MFGFDGKAFITSQGSSPGKALFGNLPPWNRRGHGLEANRLTQTASSHRIILRVGALGAMGRNGMSSDAMEILS